MNDLIPIILVAALLAFGFLGSEGPHTAAGHWQSYEERNGRPIW